MLDVETPAPDFSLQDQNGNTVTLSDLQGQPVVLYFYPRADTPGCTKQACSFRDSWEQYQEHNITVLGISNDPVENLRNFAEDYDLPFTLLSDENGEVATKYESYGDIEIGGETYDIALRNTYVINADGNIQSVYEDVSPENHADDIFDDLI